MKNNKKELAKELDKITFYSLIAKNTYRKAIMQSIIIGIIAGVVVGTLYAWALPENADTSKAASFGIMYAAIFTVISIILSVSQLFFAKKWLARKANRSRIHRITKSYDRSQ